MILLLLFLLDRSSNACLSVEASNVELNQLIVRNCLSAIHLDSTRESTRNVTLANSVISDIGMQLTSPDVDASHAVAVQNVENADGFLAITNNLFFNIANHAIFLYACCSDTSLEVFIESVY